MPPSSTATTRAADPRSGHTGADVETRPRLLNLVRRLVVEGAPVRSARTTGTTPALPARPLPAAPTGPARALPPRPLPAAPPAGPREAVRCRGALGDPSAGYTRRPPLAA